MSDADAPARKKHKADGRPVDEKIWKHFKPIALPLDKAEKVKRNHDAEYQQRYLICGQSQGHSSSTAAFQLSVTCGCSRKTSWSFRTVENPEFEASIQNLRPNYRLPSADTLASTLLNSVAASVRLQNAQ
ncbi:TPA: hypothetical protein ACH3X1_014780 [Trebouxia sp. C0004]